MGKIIRYIQKKRKPNNSIYEWESILLWTPYCSAFGLVFLAKTLKKWQFFSLMVACFCKANKFTCPSHKFKSVVNISQMTWLFAGKSTLKAKSYVKWALYFLLWKQFTYKYIPLLLCFHIFPMVWEGWQHSFIEKICRTSREIRAKKLWKMELFSCKKFLSTERYTTNYTLRSLWPDKNSLQGVPLKGKQKWFRLFTFYLGKWRYN